MTLDKIVRTELVKLAVDLFADGMSNDVLTEVNSFKENEKSRKWYEGRSKVALPYSASGRHKYQMMTFATSGHLSTPWFEDQITKERKFEMQVNYNYRIFFPTNMASNLTLVVVMIADTKKTAGGFESVDIYPPGGGHETIIFSGKIKKTFRYKLNNTNTLNIYLIRMLSESDLAYYTDKTMTGMKVEWFVEDGNSDKVEVEQQSDYVEDNKQYIKMVNMLYTAVKVMNMTKQDVWMIVKSVRFDWTYGNETHNRNCQYGLVLDAEIEEMVEAVIKKTNISTPLPATPVYKGESPTSLLDTALHMFLYIAHCSDYKIKNWIMFYENLFTKMSARTILQNIVSINKAFAPDKKKEHLVTVNLLEYLDIVMDLHYKTIAQT